MNSYMGNGQQMQTYVTVIEVGTAILLREKKINFTTKGGQQILTVLILPICPLSQGTTTQ